MKGNTLTEWLQYLESLHPSEIDLGLARIKRVAEALGLGKPAPVVFTVAGTNGKGSTVAMLSAILQAAGLRVGAYTSPHFLRYSERIRIAGQEVDEGRICAAFERIEQARGSTSLTYFEFGTLAALEIFSAENLDAVILEVGLGGRLDAVNIVDPDVAILTTVALDHVEWLGDDREQVGAEKAGIFRPGKPAIYGERDMPASVARIADELGAPLYRLGRAFEPVSAEADSWIWRGRDAGGQSLELAGLPYPTLPLDNAASAIQALQVSGLHIDTAALAEGLRTAMLMGRMQRVGHTLLDVAHNPHAATYLAARLAEQPVSGRRLAVLGMLKDKDCENTLKALIGQVDGWFVAELEGPRAQPAQTLRDLLQAQGATDVACFASVAEAYRAACEARQVDDEILVFGSFFTVAGVLALLIDGSA